MRRENRQLRPPRRLAVPGIRPSIEPSGVRGDAHPPGAESVQQVPPGWVPACAPWHRPGEQCPACGITKPAASTPAEGPP